MKRLIIRKPGNIEIQENTEGLVIKPGFVKVKISACGVCGSDISIFQGKREVEQYFGHEFTGVVTEVGSGVIGLEPGMRVASGLIKTCGRCWNCRNGHPNYCRSMDDILIPGGFATETIVEHSNDLQFLTELPKTLDDITGTLNEPASCALRIVNQADMKCGQSVLIIGLGAMGAISSVFLRNFGAGVIVCMDLNVNRLKSLKVLGFEHLINRKDENWAQQIKEVVGPNGVDLVIETTGTPNALRDAFIVARTGARIVVGSVYHEHANNFDLLPIMRKELTVIGAKGPFPYQTTRDSSTTIELLTSLQAQFKKLTKVYDYKEVNQAFREASEGYCVKAIVRF